MYMYKQTCAIRQPLGSLNKGRYLQVIAVQRSFMQYNSNMGLQNGGRYRQVVAIRLLAQVLM